LRDFEETLLKGYKDYLKVLEVFTKIKPEKILKKRGFDQDMSKRKKALDVYKRLRELSLLSFNELLRRHPHFNYRLNIL